MSHDILTIEEVAEYLRVSERTVYDWAQKGQIPGGKLGTAWRFKRSEIEQWVDRRLKSGAAAPSQPGSLALKSILTTDRVVFLEEDRKEPALRRLSGVLATAPVVRNARELETAILRREELMSTGIGFGIGVPHVRLASVEDLAMALGIARAPLTDYGSLDDLPVQIVSMVAARNDQHAQYLRALKALSSHLRRPDVRERLIEAADPEEAFRIFTEPDA